jgi:hypothetical protein
MSIATGMNTYKQLTMAGLMVMFSQFDRLVDNGAGLDDFPNALNNKP